MEGWGTPTSGKLRKQRAGRTLVRPETITNYFINQMVVRSQGWCYTFYPGNLSLPIVCRTSLLLLHSWQLERCPNTGNYHFQGFLLFSQPLSRSKVTREISHKTLHLEPARNLTASFLYSIKKQTRVGQPRIILGQNAPIGEEYIIYKYASSEKQPHIISESVNQEEVSSWTPIFSKAGPQTSTD